jgi:hypothetical protein
VDIITSVNSVNRVYSSLKKEEEKEISAEALVNYKYYTSNNEPIMAIEESPNIKAYPIQTTSSPVQYIYYAPKHSALILQLSFSLSKECGKSRFGDVGRSFITKIGSKAERRERSSISSIRECRSY